MFETGNVECSNNNNVGPNSIPTDVVLCPWNFCVHAIMYPCNFVSMQLCFNKVSANTTFYQCEANGQHMAHFLLVLVIVPTSDRVKIIFKAAAST